MILAWVAPTVFRRVSRRDFQARINHPKDGKLVSIIPILAIVIRAAWIALEVHYLSRHRIETAKDHDGHSAKLWDLANALELIGMMLGFTSVGRFQQGRSLIAVSGLFLLLTGILIRLKAIRALGEFFTGKVLIKDNHRFISSGPYRYVRHPGYSGALLAHL